MWEFYRRPAVHWLLCVRDPQFFADCGRCLPITLLALPFLARLLPRSFANFSLGMSVFLSDNTGAGLPWGNNDWDIGSEASASLSLSFVSWVKTSVPLRDEGLLAVNAPQVFRSCDKSLFVFIQSERLIPAKPVNGFAIACRSSDFAD